MLEFIETTWVERQELQKYDLSKAPGITKIWHEQNARNYKNMTWAKRQELQSKTLVH